MLPEPELDITACGVIAFERSRDTHGCGRAVDCRTPAGLSADAAASAVGVSRASLLPLGEAAEPFSRWPRLPRLPQWSAALTQSVEELRADNSMWGKKKLACR
ncbi:MAG: hypothetical protein EOQ29_34915 [Mesorhizobium sp.]|nr:MAG: hypothetical protein EOQ29_34915 [Mesorhizobium sp.]TGV30626.1 hypothetical protein EN829_036220 [Mesorhizobium sp. M00.F.Ca.ET.186.01.1.1]